MKEQEILVEEGDLDVEHIELTSDHPALLAFDWRQVTLFGGKTNGKVNGNGHHADAEDATGDGDEQLGNEEIELPTHLKGDYQQAAGGDHPATNGRSGGDFSAEQKIATRIQQLTNRNDVLQRYGATVEDPADILRRRKKQAEPMVVHLPTGTSMPESEEPRSVADPTAIQNLKDRLQERSHALAVAREEVEQLKADRMKLAAGLAERGKAIENLQRKLERLEDTGSGGSSITKMMARFFTGKRRPAENSSSEPQLAMPPLVAEPLPLAVAPAMVARVRVAEPAPEPALDPAPEPASEPEPVVAIEAAVEPAPVADDDDVAQAGDTQVPLVAVRRYLDGLNVSGDPFEIAGKRICVGRTDDNDLALLDPTVSRQHAVLRLRGRTLVVMDLGSRNGVFVNDVKVLRKRLRNGDVVAFGEVQFCYRVESAMDGDESALD